MSEARTRLARRLGIHERWHDIAGREHGCAPETEAALLAAMGIEPGSEDDALARLDDEDAARVLPPEIVLDAAIGGTLRLPRALGWRLDGETGAVLEGGGLEIAVPPGEGVWRLSLDGAPPALVIAAPRRAPSVLETTGRARLWGATGALYGLVGAQSLGVGDFGDLGTAAEGLARLGADFLGINPVHARGAAYLGHSPYSPSSRSALEPGHVAPRLVPGFGACAEAQALFADAAPAPTAGAFVDYGWRDAAAAPMLRALWAAQQAAPEAAAAKAFEAWAVAQPPELHRFALFEALSLRLGSDWRWWGAEHARPDAPGTRAFAAAHADEIAFHLWLQWLADSQLGTAQARARAAGMALGLYLDLAVGVRPDGADAWAHPEGYARGVSLGAPPDRLSPLGQSWGLAPLSPAGLRQTAFGPFRAMLRAAMRHAGLVRIDHVLGFQRAFWVPETGAPGGYVSYPLEAMLALTRLEAARQGCVVVGEDLGTVPDGLRRALGESGLYGCAVMQFEFEGAQFRPPRRYRPEVLASWGTHDTPTLRGWLAGRDIDWRARIGGGFDEGAARANRDADRHALHELLRREGRAADDEDAVADAVHALLAGSPAAMVAVSLEDALGAVEQPNLPGTTDQHPNWQRRLPVAPETVDSAPGLRRIAGLMAAARPKPEDTP